MATNFLTNLASSWEFEQLVGNFLDDLGINDLIPSGVTQGATGIFGFCGQYDGVNDYAKKDFPTGLSVGTGSLTVEFWMKSLAPTAQSAPVAHRNGSSLAGWSFFTFDLGGGNRTHFYMQDNPGNSLQKQGVDVCFDDAVHQIVAVVDRAAQLVHLYQDGVEQGVGMSTAAIGSLTNAEPFIVGSRWDGAGPGAPWPAGTTGKLDRVRLWNGRALTGVEVAELYNGGAGLAFSALSSVTPALGGFGFSTPPATPKLGGFSIQTPPATPKLSGFSIQTPPATPKLGGFGILTAPATPKFGSYGFYFTDQGVPPPIPPEPDTALQSLIRKPDRLTPVSVNDEGDISDRKPDRLITETGL